MSAVIRVFEHGWFTVPNEDGTFAIDNVPPGTYTVLAWHEGDIAETKTVTVPPQGGDVDLDFIVR